VDKISTQMRNGKAFEYAILKEFKERLNLITRIQVLDSPALETSKNCFYSFDSHTQGLYVLYASSTVNYLIDIEPRLSHGINGKDILQLGILQDQQGQDGDVRDIIVIRLEQKWEIGISAKNNHNAVKHSRLSPSIDFGEKWLGMSSSKEYFEKITPIFKWLDDLKKDSNNQKTWKSLGDYHLTVYKPILNAFKIELQRLYEINKQAVANNLVEYLVGRKDFYKVIKKSKTLEIHAFNIRGTLNLPFKNINPKFVTPIIELPQIIESIEYKEGSDTTLIVSLDKGWKLSFRIHNASSRIENSLKFDINLLSAPHTLFINKHEIRGIR
jgi:hypothetical protein